MRAIGKAFIFLERVYRVKDGYEGNEGNDEGEEPGWAGTSRNVCLVCASLGLFSNQLGCVGLEAALNTEGTDTVFSSNHMESFLILECCSCQGVELALKDVQLILAGETQRLIVAKEASGQLS